jgi:hypothetical protein
VVDGPPPKAPAPAGRSSWRETVADPTVQAVAAYALVAIAAAIAAYFTIFSEFAPYDDEGTLLVTLQSFAHGGVLYRDIYSEYGPFYYELFGGLFALTGHAVTNDISRTITVVVWVATSLLFGIGAQRLTGRLALGIVSMGAAFGALGVLANEPMHPQGLCVLLLGALFLLLCFEPTRRVGWAGAGCGAIVAALFLTKVNLGAFAIAAIGLAAAWTLPALHRRRWIRLPVIAAFLALPLLITGRDLDVTWTRELMGLELLAMVALLIAAWPQRARPEEANLPLSRWLLAAAAAFAVTLIAILAIIVVTGPSPADVWDGLIVQAMRVRDVLISQFNFTPAALDWGIAAVLAAFLVVRLRLGAGDRPSIWSAVLRFVAGLTILLSVTRITPISVGPSAGNQDTLALLLAWVAVLPPAAVRESQYRRFLRLALTALAVTEMLQVYPVAGSQVGIAAVTFVPIGAICLADGLTALRFWEEAGGGRHSARLAVVVSAVTIALAGMFILDTMLRPAASTAIAYHEFPALPFAGATALHLEPQRVETYAALVEEIENRECTTFIGYPNINSLYLWTGIEPPVPAAPGAWIKALDDEQQQRVVDQLKASPRPCAIIDQTIADAWLNGTPAPDRPLVNYIHEAFVPVKTIGEFEFALPKSRASSSPGEGP